MGSECRRESERVEWGVERERGLKVGGSVG